jgi:hypothetical protein
LIKYNTEVLKSSPVNDRNIEGGYYGKSQGGWYNSLEQRQKDRNIP